MEGILERKGWDEGGAVGVLVSDLDKQETLEFPDLDPETPIGDVLGMSASSMAVSPDVKWLLRDNRTGRLLRKEQTVGEVARDRRADLTMQPDSILG
jgi:hypothetical protein